jgi:Amt family ammonium transporter
VGIFSAEHSFMTQLIGVVCYGAFTVVCATVIFGVLKATMGIRVSEEEEIEGLDFGEHGMHAYDILSPGGGLEDEMRGRGRASAVGAAELATKTS